MMHQVHSEGPREQVELIPPHPQVIHVLHLIAPVVHEPLVEQQHVGVVLHQQITSHQGEKQSTTLAGGWGSTSSGAAALWYQTMATRHTSTVE